MDKPDSSSVADSLYAAEHDLNFLVRKILSLASVTVNERLRQIGGLTESQWRPLYYLYMHGSLRVVELARICEIDPAGMTRLLDRLETKDLCRRLRSLSDRRVVEVTLTEMGVRSAMQVLPILDEVQVELLASFDANQAAELRHMLARVASNARALNAPID